MLFQVARERRPAVLFFDNIERLLSAVHKEFSIQMNGIGQGLQVMGATSRPWLVDGVIARWYGPALCLLW